MDTKFVTFYSRSSGEEIMIFPSHIQHSHFSESVKRMTFKGIRPISGGFIVNGKCVGRSESLDLDSRPEDTVLLQDLTAKIYEAPQPEKIKPTKNQLKRARKKSR